MFGYVQIRKPELKIKDFEVYQGFYCGLCMVLKEKYGFLGELTLTYDMTFLVLLLSSVYDLKTERKVERCLVHPARKHLKLYNAATEYAADLNIILSYYHFLDDMEDETSKKAWAGSKLYRRKFLEAVRKYPKKEAAIKKCMDRLSSLEKAGEKEIEKTADCFGKLMVVLFSYKKDAFSEYFREFSYHLGRFIYIMDAYDDLEKDKEKDCFNPFRGLEKEKNFDAMVEDMLLEEIAAASVAYQKLPCINYADILGNIIYAGVWNRFDKKREEKEHERPV